MAEAPDIIKELVERYDRNRDMYMSSAYNEEQTRAEFINPFFEALGWDVANKAGDSPRYMPVLFEGTLRADGAANAPDYTFRIGGTRKFFVEAKRPGIRLNLDPSPAAQIRRDSWTAKLPIGILTNFHDFVVYDCRIPTKPTDKALHAHRLYLTYTQYLEQWDKISDHFSYNAVRTGEFDKYAEAEPRKTGTVEFDEKFLKQIEEWRAMLAQELARRNDLKVPQLNFAVQSTLDRIIFLRICEDRGIEGEARLWPLLNGRNTYGRLLDLYYHADDKYNSGLFHFRKDTGRLESPDEFTPGLKIDDKVLKSIIRGLYPPDSPYAFGRISADILGNVYEQFLGKVITLPSPHKAVVDEKPQVKKAGGVYYTPTYVVDYIVKSTVGKLCQGKTPKQIEKLRILDPACGSGSFLISAYDWLLTWHLDQYVMDGPEKHTKEIHCVPGGGWRLNTKVRKRILLNNIYGVDIDSQAVEVTKLSLLLKVLEGETSETISSDRRLLHERALPDLAGNITCGNSLIGTDFDTSGLSENDVSRISPFDWDNEFPSIMGRGGFDAVIGNPPYIRIQTMKEWAPLEVEHYKKAYKAATKGNYDIYVVFVERGLSLLNKNGQLGFILPHKFFNAQYGEPLRKLIANGSHLSEIVHFGDQQVFANATTYTCVLCLSKAPSTAFTLRKVADLQAWRDSGTAVEGTIAATAVGESEWNLTVGREAPLFEKLDSMPVKLRDIGAMFVGLQTSADTVFLFKDPQVPTSRKIKVFSKSLDEEVELETALLKPVVRSGQIGRYYAAPTALVLFPYKPTAEGHKLLTESELRKGYPKTWAYLSRNKVLLSGREGGKFIGTGWYQLYPKNLDVWAQPKIMLPYMITRLSAFHDTQGSYFVNVTTGGFGLTVAARDEKLEYFTGLLNSRLLDWFLRVVSTTFHGGYFAANKQFIDQLPMRTIAVEDPEDKARHDKMVELVDRMLHLHKKLGAATLPNDKTQIQRQIAATDREIDKLVYELYGLTDEEIKIVETSTRP